MKKYNRNAMCVKCGQRDASTKYIRRYSMSTALIPPEDSFTDAALQRVCGRCGYKWNELPLDREEEENG